MQTYKLLAPPVTRHYPLVGTAFDYLLRFQIKHINPKAITQPWVAETGAALVQAGVMGATTIKYKVINGKITRITAEDRGVKIGGKIIKDANKRYAVFQKNGKLCDELIKSALLLAQLDNVYRLGRLDPNLGTVDDNDITDLRRIYSLVEAQLFKAKRVCLLNPTFGASELVGGADADLVIDDMLIDIKATKHLRLIRRDFNQLLGYYCLYRIGGIKGAAAKHNINKLGIYYSRYGYLHIMNIDDVINQNTFPHFLVWFKGKAKEEQERRAQRRLEFKRRAKKEDVTVEKVTKNRK